MTRLALPLAALLAVACGAGGSPATRTIRDELAAEDTEALRRRAPDLVARTEDAVRRADRAEGRGDREAAADYATQARLFLSAARHEVARLEDDEARAALDAEANALRAQARRDEEARAELAERARRDASARVALAEASRALELAASDEARRRRRGRLGLEETSDLRRGARALRSRARLLGAAARSLGASAEALEALERTLTRSERARDAGESLVLADQAYGHAMDALGAARRTQDGPGSSASLALTAAATEAGLTVTALPEGVAVELPRLFTGSGARLGGRARRQAELVRRLVAAHPHGPVQVQVAGRSPSDARAQQRGEALVAVLAAGDDEDATRERLSVLAAAGDAAGSPGDVRVLFVAYASGAS